MANVEGTFYFALVGVQTSSGCTSMNPLHNCVDWSHLIEGKNPEHLHSGQGPSFELIKAGNPKGKGPLPFTQPEASALGRVMIMVLLG